MSREAMTLALDALENHTAIKHPQQRHYRDRAIDALRAALDAPEPDYERGFIDGMQEQMKRSVDQAVNAMCKREWIDITDGELYDLWLKTPAEAVDRFAFVRAALAKLKEKNDG